VKTPHAIQPPRGVGKLDGAGHFVQSAHCFDRLGKLAISDHSSGEKRKFGSARNSVKFNQPKYIERTFIQIRPAAVPEY
jgi:hypothetical protein